MILVILPERQEGQWGSSWGLESWQQTFLGAYSITKTLVLTSIILESSLCLIRAEGLPPHQQAPPSPRIPRMWGNQAWHWPHPLVSQHQTWPSWLPRPAAPGLALLIKRASRHCTRQDMAARGQGLALPISIPTIVNPTRATEPTEGTLLWWLEGSVLLGLRGCLLHRVTFPRLQNTTKLIMDTNKHKELGKMSWQRNVSQTKA